MDNGNSQKIKNDNDDNEETLTNDIDMKNNVVNNSNQNTWRQKKLWRVCAISGYVLSIWALRRLKRQALMEGKDG